MHISEGFSGDNVDTTWGKPRSGSEGEEGQGQTPRCWTFESEWVGGQFLSQRFSFSIYFVRNNFK